MLSCTSYKSLNLREYPLSKSSNLGIGLSWFFLYHIVSPPFKSFQSKINKLLNLQKLISIDHITNRFPSLFFCLDHCRKRFLKVNFLQLQSFRSSRWYHSDFNRRANVSHPPFLRHYHNDKPLQLLSLFRTHLLQFLKACYIYLLILLQSIKSMFWYTLTIFQVNITWAPPQISTIPSDRVLENKVPL